MFIQEQSITLSGLELFRLLREFVNERCDDLNIQGHDDWHKVLALRKSGELSGALFAVKFDQLRLRGSLCALLPTKAFVKKLLDGKLDYPKSYERE
jgi:hypothetical protein